MVPAAEMTPANDVVILGGGLAGLAAADFLRNTGLKVTLLEAGDRLGGRAHGEHWDAAGRSIDLGGTWLLPSFSTSFGLLDELGLVTYDSPASDLWLTHFRDGVEERQKLTAPETTELERVQAVLHRVVAESSGSLSAEEALQLARAALPDLSPRIEDWLRATQRYLAGANLVEVDAAHLLLANEDISDPEHYRTQIHGTTKALVDALVARATASIKLNARVVRVRHDGSLFRVHTADGQEYSAANLILAVPINCISGIDIDSSLIAGIGPIAREGHAGHSRKDWLVLDGVPDHFRVFASHGPFGYFRSEAKLPDGGMLAVGLAPADEGEITTESLEERIREYYLPEARIRARIAYDWGADPNAQGTWFAPRPGQPAALAALALQTTSLCVAGGDFDPEFPGTLEGALASGRRAAAAVSKDQHRWAPAL